MCPKLVMAASPFSQDVCLFVWFLNVLVNY